MTTREQLIDGLSLVIREGLRVTATFAPDDWKRQVRSDEGGWTRKQIYGHLTATAEITPGAVANLAALPEGQDAAGGFDIDAFNAQMVAAKEQLGEKELMDAFKSCYEKVIEFVKAMPEEQLQKRATFGLLEGPVIDIMDSILVLHSIAHIYSAGGSVTG